MTPAGIEPATFRFIAQLLNHCATVVPHLGPYILPNIFLSKISTACSFFANVHVSAPYDTTGLISILHNTILVHLDKSTVIPRLTSDPANDFFLAKEDFFHCFLDSANEYEFG